MTETKCGYDSEAARIGKDVQLKITVSFSSANISAGSNTAVALVVVLCPTVTTTCLASIAGI